MISYSDNALRPMFASFRIPPVFGALNHSIASTIVFLIPNCLLVALFDFSIIPSLSGWDIKGRSFFWFLHGTWRVASSTSSREGNVFMDFIYCKLIYAWSLTLQISHSIYIISNFSSRIKEFRNFFSPCAHRSLFDNKKNEKNRSSVWHLISRIFRNSQTITHDATFIFIIVSSCFLSAIINPVSQAKFKEPHEAPLSNLVVPVCDR